MYIDEWGFVKKSKTHTFVENRPIFFSFKSINLVDYYLIKHYFLASIFELICFLRSYPTFDELTFIDRNFLNFFL